MSPAISVVIPVYNAEKYIGACLESILGQTFQDFEVIVVDDCSTDNSVAVVESYVPKFGGRLKFSKTKKNSGGPSTARNKGADLSRGKYVYFVDNDDLIVDVTLETFYNAAEKFNVDVVNAGNVIEFVSETEKPFPDSKNIIVRSWQKQIPAEPTLEDENLSERPQKFCDGAVAAQAWTKLVRRDFLVENEIIFPIVSASEDGLWSLQVFCLAKKILQIPQALYVYRHLASSVSHFNRENGKVNFWNEATVGCVDFLSKFFDRQNIFQEDPQKRFDIFEYFERIHFDQLLKGFLNVPAQEVYRTLRPRMNEIFGEHGDLISYLCTSSNLSRLRWLVAAQRASELENKLKNMQGG